MILWLLVIGVLISVHTSFAADQKSLLILLENVAIKETHSLFLKSLKDRGYELTFKYADDSSLTLKQFGEYAYKHLLILAPSVREFGGQVDVRKIINFIDDGGNVIVTGSTDIGEAIREVGSECGIEFDEEATSVIDHHSYDVGDDGKHTMLVVEPDNIAKIPIITGSPKSPILYRGVSIAADPENPLLINILHGSPTSYSYNPLKPVSDYPNTVGKNTQLITALQARNDARVLFIGSLDFLSDEFFTTSPSNSITGKKSDKSGNADLADALSKWTFGERGVLRVAAVNHHHVDETGSRREYTVTDEIMYSINIEMIDELGRWGPFVADDVQFELVRIDPFIRQTLPHKGNKYEMKIKLPDVYGVFKLVVDYHRVGYTHLFSSTQISIRPFKHTQYERFIVSAYPYYASAVSMLVGVVLFSFVFLYFKDEKDKKE